MILELASLLFLFLRGKQAIKEPYLQVCHPFMCQFIGPKHGTLKMWESAPRGSRGSCHAQLTGKCCHVVDSLLTPIVSLPKLRREKHPLFSAANICIVEWQQNDGTYVSNVIQSDFAWVICSNRSGGYSQALAVCSRYRCRHCFAMVSEDCAGCHLQGSWACRCMSSISFSSTLIVVWAGNAMVVLEGRSS